MGRTLAAMLVLGLLAAGGWFLFGRGGAKAPASPAVPAGKPAPHTGAPPARGLVEAGVAAPTPAAPSSTAPEAAPDAVAAEIRALLQSGKAQDAVARAESASTATRRSPACAAAARDAALALASGTSTGSPERLTQADAARRLLGRLAVEDALPLATLRERLDALNREVLFAGRELPGVSFRSAVKPGDTLDRLMRTEWKGRVRSGYGVVLWMNNVPSPDRLRVGGLWVPEEPVRLLVRKREHTLWVLLGEVPVRFFSVGLGMNGRTPEGTFEIEELMPRPDYWPPGGKRVPFGQKGNPLGTRWMGFRDTPDAQGFGIHGTDDPDSIGKDLSQGCVRLANGDVEQLFTWATVGTLVEIRP
jgi:hypothetical protein